MIFIILNIMIIIILHIIIVVGIHIYKIYLINFIYYKNRLMLINHNLLLISSR